jgi:hypothetical protein
MKYQFKGLLTHVPNAAVILLPLKKMASAMASTV